MIKKNSIAETKLYSLAYYVLLVLPNVQSEQRKERGSLRSADLNSDAGSSGSCESLEETVLTDEIVDAKNERVGLFL